MFGLRTEMEQNGSLNNRTRIDITRTNFCYIDL